MQSVVGDVLLEAVRQGAPAEVAWGLYRELVSRQAQALVGGDTLSECFSFLKGFGQGPSETPALFTAALDRALAGAVSKWQEKGWGFAWTTSLLNHFLFVDDILSGPLSGIKFSK